MVQNSSENVSDKLVLIFYVGSVAYAYLKRDNGLTVVNFVWSLT